MSALEQYEQRDLDYGLGDAFAGRTFDRVLFMDVLEHLRRPEQLLEQCRALLKANGRVVVSVPNVANLTVRLGLLFGRWQYAERGIMDRTHMRFYTRKTARRLLEAAGFRVIKQQMTVMPLEVVIGSPDRNVLLKLVHWMLIACTKMWPGFFGYQSFLIAELQTRSNSTPAEAAGTLKS